MSGPDPTGDWPAFPWRAPGTDYRELVRYVTPAELRSTHLTDRRPDLLAPEARGEPERWRAVAQAYDQMVRAGFTYNWEPFGRAEAQVIRSVYDALGASATCLDLALIYAALCLEHELYCLLILTEHQDTNHAVIGVLPALDVRAEASDGRRAAVPWIASADGSLPGLGDSRDVCLSDIPLLDGTPAGKRLLVVDPTLACCGKDGTGAAPSALAINPERYGKAPQDRVRVLDVPWLLAHAGFEPRTPPRRAGLGISTQIPRDAAYRSYPSRGELLDQLGSAEGLVVIHGAPGSGKSMLAREAAIRADDGAGWVIRADDARTVEAELARAEARERGVRIDGDAADRSDLAEEARGRLVATRRRWVVVADNADAEGTGADGTTDRGQLVQRITDRLPSPGPGQLLIVTTTYDAWRAVVEAQEADGSPACFVELGPLPDGEVEEAYPHLTREERELADGSPLLAAAFAAFGQTTGRSVTAIPQGAPAAAGAHRAAGVLWRAVRSHVERGQHPPVDRSTLDRAAYLSAFLPPSHVDERLVDEVTGNAGGVTALLDLGLLRRTPADGIHFLHRMFVRVVRADLDGGRCAADLFRWSTHDRYVEALDRFGTAAEVLATGAELERRATGPAGSEAGPEAVAQALATNASLLEQFGLTGDSAGRYGAATRYLDEGRPEDWRWLAEARHGQHRKVNQDKHATRDELVASRAAMREVVVLRRRHAEGVDRGDLTGDAPLAWAEDDQSEEDAQEALAELVKSAQAREELLGPEHVLTIRGKFNVAAQQLRLGKVFADPARADEKFHAAITQYREVGTARRAYHRRADHPHVASCEHGVGIAHFNKAVYGTAPDRGVHDCLVELDTAQAQLDIALQMRRQVPPTPLATGDILKSWSALDKVGTAQRCLRDAGYAVWWAESMHPAPGTGRRHATYRDDHREIRHLLDRLSIVPLDGADVEVAA